MAMRYINTDIINGLSDECILHILSYLHGGVVLRCSIVCKRWYRISRDNWLWITIFAKEFSDHPKYSKLANQHINHNIAVTWNKSMKKPLIKIYVEMRRREKIKKRVFPIVKSVNNNEYNSNGCEKYLDQSIEKFVHFNITNNLKQINSSQINKKII